MKKQFLNNKWEYEILKAKGEGLKGYGYNLFIYKNNSLVYNQGGFGSVTMAELSARDYFLLTEFNIERD